MHQLEHEVLGEIKNNALLNNENTVVIGVSGGGDSMALFHILAALRRILQLTLVPVYVDHGLRPKETPGERQLVSSVAASYGLAAELVQVAVLEKAGREKKSIEQAARDLRYQTFTAVKKRSKADCIAVAHTRDDQVEEVLHRFLRGSSRKALAGMAMKNGDIIRPLLHIEKRRLLSYLRDKQFSFCHDSSNDDDRFFRNRIRRELLPLLERHYNQGISSAILKTASNMSVDEALLEQLTKSAWEAVYLPLEKERGETEWESLQLHRLLFLKQHPALQRRVIEKALWRLGTEARYEHIVSIVDAARAKKSGIELHLSKGLRAVISRERILFLYPLGQRAWRGSVKKIS
ncbi:MAG: tRNA lysidine(34) synthetase TilS [Desulfobulbus propionicus]|nr:MAG: tRNA lysidine(34) synthetase TilS [Desulfobulbus propionicus]